MAKKNTGINVEYKVINQAFNKGISEMDSQVKTLNKGFGVQKEQMKNTASESDKLEASVNKLNQEYELAEQKTKMVESALQNTKEITGENSKETERWTNKLLDAQKNQEHLKNAILESNQALDKAKQAESQLAAEQDKLTQNTKRLDTLFEATGKSLDDYTDILGTRMVDAIRKGEASSDQLELAINKIGKSALGADADLGKMKNALDQVDNGSSVDDVSQDLRELSTESDRTADALEEMGDKLSAGNLLEGAEALSEVSDKVTDVATAAFESAMTIDGLAGRYNKSFGLTGEEAEKTKDKIISLYKTGLVDSYEEATNTLIKTREQLKGINEADLGRVTEKAQTFASVFDTDIDESLRGVNALMTTYGLTVDEAFDLMTVGAQNGLNKTDELGDNLAEYAGLFKENGYSAAEMFEILQGGLDGGAYNLDKVNDLVKEFGVRISDGSVEKAIGEMGGGFEALFETWKKGGGTNKELFNSLANEIAGMSSEQEKATAISEIFGSLGEDAGNKVIESMGSLSREVTGVEEKYEDVSEASEKLAEASDSQNLTSMFRELQDMLRPVGEKLMEIALEYMPKVINGVKGIVEWFDNLSPYWKLVSEFVGIFSLLAIVIAPIAAVIAAIIGVLGSLAAPILLAVAAIAGIILAIKNWGNITDWLSEKWAEFTEWLSNSWKATYDKAEEIFFGLGEFFSGIWTSITETASEKWSEFTTFISEIWTNFIEGAADIWNGVVEFFSELWTSISTNAQEAWTAFVEFMSPIIENLVNVIMVPISLLQKILEGIWLLIVAGATIAWEGLKIAAIEAWGFIKNAIVTPVVEAWTSVKGKLQEMWSGIESKFIEIKNTALTKWNEIKTTITDKFTEAKSTIVSIASEIWTNVTTKFEEIRSATVEKWNAVKAAVTTPITNAKNTVVRIAGEIWTNITSKFEQVRTSVVSKFNAVKNAIIDPIREAKNKVGDFIDGIKGFFSGLKLKIPKPSMPSLPSFGLKTSTKTVFGKEITYPSGINIKWNAEGGIMKKPTIFGAMGNSLMGGGEAGPEAILPLNDHVLGSIGVGIMQALEKRNTDSLLNASVGSNSMYINVQSILDGRVVADSMTDPIDTRLSNKSKTTSFGKTGRFE